MQHQTSAIQLNKKHLKNFHEQFGRNWEATKPKQPPHQNAQLSSTLSNDAPHLAGQHYN